MRRTIPAMLLGLLAVACSTPPAAENSGSSAQAMLVLDKSP